MAFYERKAIHLFLCCVQGNFSWVTFTDGHKCCLVVLHKLVTLLSVFLSWHFYVQVSLNAHLSQHCLFNICLCLFYELGFMALLSSRYRATMQGFHRVLATLCWYYFYYFRYCHMRFRLSSEASMCLDNGCCKSSTVYRAYLLIGFLIW